MSKIIRKATVLDVEVISKIHASSWKTAYQGIVPQSYLDELKDDFWVATFQNWLSNHTLTVQLMYEKELPVGCIAYGKARDDKYSAWGEIISIYVLPNYLRKGYGKKMLELALLDMNTSSYQKCYLWVLKENWLARNFYEKNGFQATNDQCTIKIKEKKLTEIRYIQRL